MSAAKIWIATLIATMCLALALCGRPARGHSIYEYDCCSDRDCAPVAEGEILDVAEGYRVRLTGETFGHADPKVRFSPDGRWHRCSEGGRPQGKTLCLYVPGRGS
jgi:hypothetical protein